MQQQKYDSFLVLDFEATCDSGKRVLPQEVIEFPCIKINAQTCEVQDTFHKYVRPELNPELTSFCTELTGITQDMVDDKPCFKDVFTSFRQWLDDTGALKDGKRSIFVTCGDWDLQWMLPNQCLRLGIEIPPDMQCWIDIKKTFYSVTEYFPAGLADMLSELKLPLQGRLHSGIDDCRNVASIVRTLIDMGTVLEENSRFYYTR